jgi:hypothetical protein
MQAPLGNVGKTTSLFCLLIITAERDGYYAHDQNHPVANGT